MLPEWYKHSPSSGNLYREAPDAFLWRYGFGKRDEKNGRMAAGTAAEFAAAQVLLGVIAETAMGDCALAEFDKIMQGEVSPERDDLPAIAVNVLGGLRAIDKPLLTYQHKLTLPAGERYGLKYPIIAYTDFAFEGLTVDCKVTWAVPSKPRFSHVCQLGTYNALSGKGQALLYASPKKRTRNELNQDELSQGFAVMLSAWQRIEALAQRFNRAEDAALILPHNPDSFYWNPTSLKEAAAVWNPAV